MAGPGETTAASLDVAPGISVPAPGGPRRPPPPPGKVNLGAGSEQQHYFALLRRPIRSGTRRNRWLALGVASALLVGGVCWLGYQLSTTPREEVPVPEAPPVSPLGDAVLVDRDQTRPVAAPVEKDGHRPLLEDGGKSIATLAGAKTQAGGPGETVVAPGLSMDVNRSGPGGAMDLTTIYGARTQHTLEYLNRKGGTWKSETAVAGGLNWLARHQADDGHWSDEDKCEQDQPCPGRKPLRPASVGAGPIGLKRRFPPVFPSREIPFPSPSSSTAPRWRRPGWRCWRSRRDGHYYFNEHKYSQQVRRGLDWLVKQQKDGCLFGPKQTWYEHGIGTFALAEACAVARAEGHKPDPRYLKAATQAVKFLERHQYAHGGWRYDLDSNTSADTSVTGWQVLRSSRRSRPRSTCRGRPCGKWRASMKRAATLPRD